MTTNTNTPSGFTPRSLTSWTKYFIPQADTNVYRVGDVVKSSGTTDAAGNVGVTLHPGTGAARGVIVSVDPGLPATGGQQPSGQKLSVPATKGRDYYVWVLDDPAAQFTVIDDGLTPANLVPASVGSFVNFTPGAAASASNASTAALTSSTFGGASGSGCVKVRQLLPGQAYGANAAWIVQFAQHELASFTPTDGHTNPFNSSVTPDMSFSGKSPFDAANGITVTIDKNKLDTSFVLTLLLPIGGSITIASANGALLDGVTTSQTRTYSSTSKLVTILSRAVAGSFVVAP